MDKHDHKTTRRALLGAAAALPAAALIGGAAIAAPSTDRAAWECALDTFRQADADMEAYLRDHLGPASRAYQAVRDKWPMHYDFANDPNAKAELASAHAAYDPAEHRFDELVDEQCDACEALIVVPAPDTAALLAKIDIAIKHEVYEWTERAEMMAAFQRDAHRLLSTGRA
jgi:hypothetical protein